MNKDHVLINVSSVFCVPICEPMGGIAKKKKLCSFSIYGCFCCIILKVVVLCLVSVCIVQQQQ